jgi:hypothetical protein
MLARKSHTPCESIRSLRALKQTLRVCLRACFKISESKQTVSKPSLQKAAEFSGVAGEFRCLSLHCSQILSLEICEQCRLDSRVPRRSADSHDEPLFRFDRFEIIKSAVLDRKNDCGFRRISFGIDRNLTGHAREILGARYGVTQLL